MSEIQDLVRDAKSPIRIDLIDDKADWNALLSRCAQPHITQSFAYGEGKAATGWRPRRVVFSCGGRPVAIATVLEFRRLGLRFAALVNRGPMFLDSLATPDLIVAVYTALRRRWGRLSRGGIMLIAPALHSGDDSRALLKRAGYRLRREGGWGSGRIDLSKCEEDIWRGFDSTFRNRVRNAEKMGARVRCSADESTFEWMIERHLQNMNEKGFSGAEAKFLRAMRSAAPEDVRVFQLMLNEQPVAGMSVVQFGQTAEYHIGWFGPEGRKLNGGNFLMWQIMRDLKTRGVTVFDLGGMSDGNGYSRFKRTMRPVEFKLADEWISF